VAQRVGLEAIEIGAATASDAATLIGAAMSIGVVICSALRVCLTV
jgi:hypothetical protein